MGGQSIPRCLRAQLVASLKAVILALLHNSRLLKAIAPPFQPRTDVGFFVMLGQATNVGRWQSFSEAAQFCKGYQQGSTLWNPVREI